MIDRGAQWIAAAAAGELVAGDPDAAGPRRAVVDTRRLEPGDLFVGLRGTRVDGGQLAQAAIDAGAWGVLVERRHAPVGAAVPVIAVDQPLAALQALARRWRRALGSRVVAITGSTGKTSTKDIVAAMLRARMPTHATRENLNTEIGLPLTILEAPPGTDALVLEMAMRGPGQIAELVAIAEPDVGVIVNVGPVHLELLGTVERVAAAKAELIRDLAPGAACVVPAGEPLLEPHLRADLRTISFGAGGDVRLVELRGGVARIAAGDDELTLELSFSEPHNVLNALAGVAALRALGVEPPASVAPRFSSLRGEIVELPGGVTVVNDCYNANPMSMRAAIEHLAASPAARRVAVLGAMAELGPDAARYHREVGETAARAGIDVLVTVGEDAAAIGAAFRGEQHAVATPEAAADLLERSARAGDRVLVKGSRSAGLERVLERARSVGSSR